MNKLLYLAVFVAVFAMLTACETEECDLDIEEVCWFNDSSNEIFLDYKTLGFALDQVEKVVRRDYPEFDVRSFLAGLQPQLTVTFAEERYLTARESEYHTFRVGYFSPYSPSSPESVCYQKYFTFAYMLLELVETQYLNVERQSERNFWWTADSGTRIMSKEIYSECFSPKPYTPKDHVEELLSEPNLSL